jgi:hypothetical protein
MKEVTYYGMILTLEGSSCKSKGCSYQGNGYQRGGLR